MAFSRSWLFVPGNRPDRFAKAAGSGTQAVILDLEDAVAPDQKDAARAAVCEYLGTPGAAAGASIAVRINPASSRPGLKDLLALSGEISAAPDYIVMPKAEAGAEIALLGRLLDECRSPSRIVALVETARGIAGLKEISEASPRLAALMFGAADYAADLGMRVSALRSDFARAALVNAAAAGGLAALDSPFFDVGDEAGLARECAASAALGFHAKAAIHPSQLAAIGHAFDVNDEDRNLARQYLNASIDGVGMIDGKMVDVAMLNWARRIV
ncbi:aldolase/citrate lyase family protein [Sphingobium estronivorans]|uniref:aldolase/citrate lyase family protein n=1 Tax=Sphingobium estronivorans TaxID=1577690 RepID=UPI0012389ADF|nr:aldolase/citrate lyase family protein [Sphingobium estronivorans]